MHYDAPPRRRSTGTVIIVVILLGFMFLVALGVAGFVALMFARARTVHQMHAVAEAQMAEAAARAQAEQQRMWPTPDSTASVPLPPEIPAPAQPAAPGMTYANPYSSGDSANPYSAQGGSGAYGVPPSVAPQVTLEIAPAASSAVANSIRIAEREVTVQLDAEGKIQVDGTACELLQLKESLQKAGEGREDAVVVIVKADKQCRFEHLAAVPAVCKELKLAHVRISAVEQ